MVENDVLQILENGETEGVEAVGLMEVEVGWGKSAGGGDEPAPSRGQSDDDHLLVWRMQVPLGERRIQHQTGLVITMRKGWKILFQRRILRKDESN